MTNRVLIGYEIERKAVDILLANGFEIINKNVRRIMSYDIIAKKDSKLFLIEVKGRSDEQRKFCINEIKIERLLQEDEEVLFIFINQEGYVICSLDDIINNSLLKINNKKIWIGFNRSYRTKEHIKELEVIA